MTKMDYLHKRGKELETNFKTEVLGKKRATLDDIPDIYKKGK